MKEYEKFIKAVETSGEVIFLTDCDGLITYVNPEFTRLYGYQPEEVVGKTTPRILKSGRMHKRDYVVFWQTLLAHQVVKGEFINKCKNGRLVHIEGSANPILDEYGQLTGFLAIQRDITHRKQAQKALVETHEFLQSVIDGVADPLMVIGEDYRVRLINRAGRAFFGIDAGIPEPEYCYHVSHHREKACNGASHPACPLEEVRKTGEPITVLHEHFQADCEVRFVEVAAAPYKNTEGDFQGIIETWRDVTERTLAEAELKHYTQRLRWMAAQIAEVEEAERQRLANELHDEIGQNLTAIGINLNIIRSQLPKEVETAVRFHLEDSYSLVDQTAERIRFVMADLRPPVLDDYGLAAALRWYCDQISRRAEIQIVVECDNNVPRLDTRLESTLFRIAQEALNNVVKHSHATLVQVNVQTTPDRLFLRVEDNGIGFDMLQMEMPESKRGWGLLSMRERAESIGGRCMIETSLQGGTSVIVEVPRG